LKLSEIIKDIRRRTGESQQSLAAALNVSFSTINRWETGKNEPTPLAMESIRSFCQRKGIDFSEFEGNTVRTGSGSVILYHGSKSGIKGDIKPISREFCDFGRGFYMGTERTQPLTLICNFPNAMLYTVDANLTGLRVLEIEVGIDWALLIAYNRGKLAGIADSSIYRKYANMADGCDVIIGDIADDRMFVVLDRFFMGEITDTALIGSLSALKLGKQYVAVTGKACRQIDIIEEKPVGNDERNTLRNEAEAHRLEGIRMAEEICRRHRRDGRFIDEILEGGISP
jgi:transcriptional regulator with XRE-family HTH domain